MSFRTVVITRQCKLDLCMGYLEVRRADGKKRIFLDEIGILILENPAIALTGCLLSELMRKKIKVIFCDARHNPQGELVPYGGLFHDNVFNPFNFSYDLIEPFRILVDRFVYRAGFREFGTEEKHQMLKLFQQEVRIQDTRQQLSHAVPLYVQSVFRALNEGDSSLIRFYCHELPIHADPRIL